MLFLSCSLLGSASSLSICARTREKCASELEEELACWAPNRARIGKCGVLDGHQTPAL